MTRLGPELDDQGRIKGNAVVKTLAVMTPEQCVDIVLKVLSLFRRVKLELEFTE
jgi:hypothetical protein